MLRWPSLVTVQMANNLIKWWRTKFLNGYKQFSVIQMDSNDGHLSDTEELLGSGSKSRRGHGKCFHGHGYNGDNGDMTMPTCSTPPAAAETSRSSSSPLPPSSPSPSPQPPLQPPPPSQTPTAQQNKHLNLEEFSCDVSMEGGVYRDGQEFSFTLYDFDGHGKITKDDIAGLVTTIYETLGSSVKVPHYGSKTIKVKLTVSPDQRKRMSATVIDHKSPSHHNQSQNQNQNQNHVNNHHQNPNSNQSHCHDNKVTKEDDRDNNTEIYAKQQQNQPQRNYQNQYQQQQERQGQRQRQRRQKRGRCRQREGDQELEQEQEQEHDQDQDRDRERAREQEREHVCCNVDMSDVEVGDYSDHCSRVSEDEITEDEGECSEDQITKHPARDKIKPKRFQKVHFRPQTYFTPAAHVHPYSTPVLCTKARRNKKKSSSLQRKELLEIIQANMEKNNHSFQTTSRKQHVHHIQNESEQTPSVEQKEQRHKHKIVHDSTAQLQCLANIVNSENCYLDLATLQDDVQVASDGQNVYKHLPYCRYDKLLGAVVCMTNKQLNYNILPKTQATPTLTTTPPTCRHKRQFRSRSHDLSQIPYHYNLLESHHNNNNNNNNNNIKNSAKKSNIAKQKCDVNVEQSPASFKKQVKKIPQVVLGHSSSPHHLKHRNRQEDQARAMAQVVRWLEQEFSSNVNVNMHKKSDTKKTKANNKFSPQQPQPTRSSCVSGAAVERHEHHHVHEHIHHHYHHYQEAPVVV